MSVSNGLFTIKLYEMERAFGHLQGRLQLCQTADLEKIRREIELANDEFLEVEMLLKRAAERSRTPLVAELAQAQEAFNKKTQTCLQQALDSTDELDAQAEVAAVCAEFAIDQAIQAMNYALLSALNAIERQLAANESMKEEQL